MNSVNIYDIRHRWVNFNFISLFICMFMPMYTINYRHCMLKSVFLQPIKLAVWRMHTTHSQTFNYFNDNGLIQAKKLKEKKNKARQPLHSYSFMSFSHTRIKMVNSNFQETSLISDFVHFDFLFVSCLFIHTPIFLIELLAGHFTGLQKGVGSEHVAIFTGLIVAK